MVKEFVVSIYGAFYVNTKYSFLDKLKGRGISFFNSKAIEEKQDPSENDQYYLTKSDFVVVVVDDPRDAKTLRDITAILDYINDAGKPVVFVLPNIGKFGKERDSYYAAVDVLLKSNGVNPIYCLDDVIQLITEAKEKKLAEANDEETAN